MANRTGSKGNRGGSMRRNKFGLELGGFEEMITKLEGLGGEVQAVVTDALQQAAETVNEDTKDALASRYLPAHGKYSTGETKKSVSNNRVTWSGTVAEVGVGFDKTKPGAGGFLISGTPRMQPDAALAKIYTKKKYKQGIQDDMIAVVEDAIDRVMEGRK